MIKYITEIFKCKKTNIKKNKLNFNNNSQNIWIETKVIKLNKNNKLTKN